MRQHRRQLHLHWYVAHLHNHQTKSLDLIISQPRRINARYKNQVATLIARVGVIAAEILGGEQG